MPFGTGAKGLSVFASFEHAVAAWGSVPPGGPHRRAYERRPTFGFPAFGITVIFNEVCAIPPWAEPERAAMQTKTSSARILTLRR
jgi:hypothetical protein